MVLAQIVYVVLSMAWVGVPLMIPVAESKTKPSGRSGETSHVAPGTALGGLIGVVSVLFTRTVGPSGPVPTGLESGPAKQSGGTALGPSQIPSPSVSGFKESVPRSPVPL